uniref:Putative secreted protein n=1 Tax=Amblyomma triste TaxID=251400 RepID=A0A023G227_AMBTT
MKLSIPIAFIVFALVMTSEGQIPSGSIRPRPVAGAGQAFVQGQILGPMVQGQRHRPGVPGQRPGAGIHGQEFGNGQGFGQAPGRPRPAQSHCIGLCGFGQRLGESCGLACKCGVSPFRTPDPQGRLQCMAYI